MLLSLTAMPAFASDRYRASYELILEVGNASFRIQTQSSFSKAMPIQHDLGNYRVLLILTETSESEYSMNIVVRESGVDSMQSDILEHAIKGSFSGIVEFSSANGSANIEGAIAVNPLR